MASAASPPLPGGGVRPTASVDALYAMMKRKQAEAADINAQAKKAKRRDDSNAALNPAKRRKPSLPPSDASRQTDSKKKGSSGSSSGSSKASVSSALTRPPVTAASLLRTIRSSPTPPPGGSSDLPASSLAAQLVLSSSLSASSPSSALLGPSSFSPRALSRPHWSHEPVSRRNASGQLVTWPIWIAAHSKAQQLVSQGGAVRKAAGGKARAQSRRDDVVYSSDDGDDDSELSDVELADLPDDDVPTHPLRPSTFYQPPVNVPPSLLLALRPDKRDAEIEKLELKLLSKKAVIDRETRRPYVDMEGGSRHMAIDDPLDKPPTVRQSSITAGIGGTGSSSSATSKSMLPFSTSSSSTTTATSSSPSSTGISIPFTKHDGSFICGLCAKPFPDLSKLRRHANTHMDGDRRRMDEKGGVREAAYVCSYPECGKSFLHLNSLRFHERSHKQPAAGQPLQPPPRGQQQQQQSQGREEKEVRESSKGVKAEPGVKMEVKRESG